MPRRDVDIVVLSDIHLGTYGAHATELNRYLKSIQPRVIILNGDIIDIWQFSKRYWPKSHWTTLQLLLDFIQEGVQVFYLTGNHDDVLRRFSDYKIKNFQLLDKLILNLDGKKAWVFHGDVFDLSINYAPWLAKLGGKSYDYLILFNRFINTLLMRLGKDRISLSKKIKNSVKKAVRFISDYEEIAIQHALGKSYDYVICGHIHQPCIRTVEKNGKSTTYLNSGDWIENLTALEYIGGKWTLFHYYEYFAPVATNQQEEMVEVVGLFNQTKQPVEVAINSY